MGADLLKLPDTLDGLADDELFCLPATWEEYFDVLETAPYTVQFLNSELIMSQATRLHESLVIILGVLLSNHFVDKADYDVLSSNIKLVIPNQVGDVNADVSVVKEPVEYGSTPGGNMSTVRITNPIILVEVLSKSTRNFDQGEKLAAYKLIPSLQHILFVDQTQPYVALPMVDIYRKTTFGAPSA